MQENPSRPSGVCAHCGRTFYRKKPSQLSPFCTRGCGNRHRVPPLATRFWPKVDRSGGPDACWPWTGYRNSDGYGTIAIGGKGEKAHRTAYRLARGPIQAGHSVCHRCDNPPCCNPGHLFTESHAGNMADKSAKGRVTVHRGDDHWTRKQPERLARGGRNGAYTKPERVLRGERHGQSRLTDTDVRSIRERFAAGEATTLDLAAEYGVSRGLIYQIIRRKAWRHVA